MSLTIGAVVRSRAGRDKERYFLVTQVDNNYAMLVDGDLRKIEKPKRKKLKHVEYKGDIIHLLKGKIENGVRISNAEVRKLLSLYIEEKGLKVKENI